MKRISKRYLLIAILVLGLILSVGCMSIDFSFNDYKPEFPEHRPKELVKDEGFEIDGVLNEEIWATLDNEIRAQYSEDVYLTSKSYQGEKGVYFGITVKDFAIYYNPDRSISRNSSVEVYLSTFGKMKMDEYCVNLRVCPTDNEGGIYFESWIEDPTDPANLVKWYFEWEAAVTVQGIINTSECEGFTVEIFVPWSTLGVETAEYIQYYAAFNHVETDSVYESERTFVGIQGCRVHSPSTWITVNNGGVYNTYEIYNTYMKTDPEVVIDGKLDEDVWKGNQTIKYYRKDTDYSLEANSYITEKGIYIGITVEDKYIYYADTSVRPIGLNSGVELYIAPFGATSVTSNCLQLRITATGVYTTYIGSPTEPSYPWKQTPFPSKVATFIDGEVNAEDISENEGYTVEIYIPWFVMGVQNRDKFLLYPCLVHTENAELAEKVLPWTYTSTGSHSHFHDPTYDYFPMSKDGYVVSSIGVNDILLDSRNIEGDYYTAQFDVNIRYPEFIGANAMPVIRTIKASFAEVEDLEIEEGEQQYILKIHKDEISSFISGKSVQVSAYGVSTSFKVSYSLITVDGTVDEEVWAPNTHTTRNTTHGVTQTTNIYFGVSGLYLGYVVIDPRASDTIKDENGYTMTHLEVYLTVGDEVSVDTTFQFRLYTDGKYRSYNYRDASFPWTERTGSNLLPAVYAVKMTEDGYNCELFIPYNEVQINDYGYTVALYIPYTTVGLIAVPEQFAIISVVFYGTSSSATTLSDYYNGTKFYNALVREYNEYLIFDENGYVEPVVTSEDAAVFIDFDNDVANSGKNGSINVSIVANEAKSTDFLPYTGTPVYETGNSETADDKALKINHLNGPNVCIEDYNFGLGDFTISGWFYLDPSTSISSGNSTYLFGAVEQPDSSRSIFVTLRKASGEYRIGFKQGNATSTNILTVGDMTGWHMYTLVRSSGTVKLYIDGVFISYKDNAAVDLGVTDIGIGSYYGTSWSYYNNDLLVDDFCVFDRALSIDEIKALMDYQSR